MNYSRKSVIEELQITRPQLVAAMHHMSITPFKSGNVYTTFSEDQVEALRSYCRVNHPFKKTLVDNLKYQESLVAEYPTIENIRKLHELRLKYKQTTGSKVMTTTIVGERPTA